MRDHRGGDPLVQIAIFSLICRIYATYDHFMELYKTTGFAAERRVKDNMYLEKSVKSGSPGLNLTPVDFMK